MSHQNTIEFSADRVKLKTIDEQLYDHVIEYGPVPSDAGQSRPSVRVFGALARIRLPELLREDALEDDLLNDNTVRFVLLPWLYREVFFEDPDLEKQLPAAGKIEALVRAVLWTYVHCNYLPLLYCLISKFVELLDATNLVDALKLMDKYAERIEFDMPDDPRGIPATIAIKSFAFYKLHELVSSFSAGTIVGFQEHGELVVRALAAVTPQVLDIAAATKGFGPQSSLAGHLSSLFSQAHIDGTVNVQEERIHGNLVLRRPSCGEHQEPEHLRLYLPLIQHVPFFQKYLDGEFSVEVIDAADIVTSVDAFKSTQELGTHDRVQLLLYLLQFCYTGKLSLISEDSVGLVSNLRFLIHLAFYFGLQDTAVGKQLLAFCDEKLVAYGYTVDELIASIIEIY